MCHMHLGHVNRSAYVFNNVHDDVYQIHITHKVNNNIMHSLTSVDISYSSVP